MFSKSLARAANRTCAAAAGSSTSTTSAVQRTTHCLAARRQPHQRRHSSSKAPSSCPPGDPASDGKPVAEEKAAIADPTAQEQQQQQQPPPQRGTKRVTRSKRSRPAGVPDKQEDQFAGLPAVPGMQMSSSEFGMSSFFSLHRPLSLTTTIPPPSTPATFDSIFVSQKQRDPWENGNSAERRPEDVVYALRHLFEDMNSRSPGQQAEDDGVRWEVIQDSSASISEGNGVKHLDGSPRLKTLEEMVAQFRPFEAPPPPQPFPEHQPKTSAATEKKQRTSKPKQTRYATTMLITESTSESGQTTYTASTSPFVRIPEGQESVTPTIEGYQLAQQQQQQQQGRIGFRERMYRNQRAFLQRRQEHHERRASSSKPAFIRNAPSAARLNRMLLISVKRQRKLKMKKHKYKKLMRRTRNLRRRQDRT